jgi:AraC family transcriptional regulator
MIESFVSRDALQPANTLSVSAINSEPIASVVFAQTSSDRVDLMQQLDIRITQKARLTITRVARKSPEHGITNLALKTDSYVACVHLTRFSGCEFWRDEKNESIGPLEVSSTHINDMRHSWRADIRSSFDVLNFGIPQATLDEIISEDRDHKSFDLCCPMGSAASDAVMMNFAQALLPALEKPNTANRLFVDHTARAVTAHLANAYGTSRSWARDFRGGLAPWQEKRAKEMLRAKLSGDVSVSELASACRLSTGYFSRAFKRTIGCAPHQWLIQKRIELAKHLILNTDEPLCQVALTTGFVDQSHFTRVFSQQVKSSPAAWRRNHGRQTPAASLDL